MSFPGKGWTTPPEFLRQGRTPLNSSLSLRRVRSFSARYSGVASLASSAAAAAAAASAGEDAAGPSPAGGTGAAAKSSAAAGAAPPACPVPAPVPVPVPVPGPPARYTAQPLVGRRGG